MANQQLKDYISQQLEKGTGKEAIAQALLGVGWPQSDINEAMESLFPSSAPAASVGDIRPVSAPATPKVAVSELATSAAFSSAAPKEVAVAASFASATPVSSGMASQAAPITKVTVGASRTATILAILFAVIAVGTGAGMGYYIVQNNALSAKVSELSAPQAPATDDAAVKKMQDQIEQLKKAAEVSALTTAAARQELSLWTAPAGATGEREISFEGTVAGGAGKPYTVTTLSGTVVTIKNSKDAKVDAAIKPLVGQMTAFKGAHAPASREVTIVSVNDTLLSGGLPVQGGTIPPAEGGGPSGM